MTNEERINQFKEAMRGEVVQPGDAGYDDARKVYNAMTDKRPKVIARCADVADVMTAVDFGRESGLDIAVRAGGHSAPGFGTCDDGLVIDLSGLKGIRVDPVAKTVRVEAGCQWGDVDHATHPFGLAAVGGVISTTGVAGLTLGGGHGYLTRKYGMSVDNLLEADMVLADGRFVKASPKENTDLFWAIRGGGGNFGVVTSFLFRLHPVKNIVGGVTFWPLEQAADALKWYQEYITAASEDMFGFFAFLIVPPAPPFPEELHGRNLCGAVWCYTGPEDEAEAAFRPIRGFGPPIFEHIGPMPFPALQTMFDPLYPPGHYQYWKGDFVRKLNDDAVKQHLKYGAMLPTGQSTMHLYPINGAVHRVGKEETAFRYRDVTWSMVIVGVDPDPANSEKITAWARDYWQALRPYSAEGGYLNFMMEEGQERVKATYLENYDRLAAIKKRYDPNNVFHMNQNIAPAA